MKILYIKYITEKQSGGNIGSTRSLDMLKLHYSENKIIEFEISRSVKFQKTSKLLWSILSLWNDIRMCAISGFDKSHRSEVMRIIKEKNVDLVFLDTSMLGTLSKKIKKKYPDVRIITFFHNVEYLFYKDLVNITHTFYLYYRVLINKISETRSCIYSNIIITLNARDANNIEKYYGRKSDFIIPVCIKDKFKLSSEFTDRLSKPYKTGLFVGSYFPANIEGIIFFIKNILPLVDMKFVIVGSGMIKLQNMFHDINNLEIFSNVQDLTPYYELADFMVMPIFSGSGMKVKTAEALMYGKYIIGTKEAFMGYDISETIGICCDSVHSFVEAIAKYDTSRSAFNNNSRELYLKHYSYSHSISLFKNVFNSL